MRRYKIGNKIIHKTTAEEAYYHNLISDEKLNQKISNIHTSYPGYKNPGISNVMLLVKTIRFYGIVTGIEKGFYADEKTPYRQINCLFSNGKKTGFLEDNPGTLKKFRKANILEKLLKKFKPSEEVKLQQEFILEPD